MNNFRALVIILTIAAIAKSDDSSCLYEFESDSEMEDFDSTCDGLKGEWKIEDVPDNIPIPSGHGSKGLTIKQQSNGCLQSSKKVRFEKKSYATIFRILFLLKVFWV